jgi:hypothetical protein
MRCEGAWVRVYRAHHKADTMTTTGHIAKAHREINGEKGLNDFPTHVVDVVGVGAGVWTAWSSSAFRQCRTTAVRLLSTGSASKLRGPRQSLAREVGELAARSAS